MLRPEEAGAVAGVSTHTIYALVEAGRLHFTEAPPTNYDEVTEGVANGLYRRFFRAMLDRGIALAPGPYEAAFPSLAHTKDDLERTVDLASAAAAEVAAAA